MATYTEGALALEFLKSCANGSLSFEKVTIAANSGELLPGRVLGKTTSNGKYVAYDNASGTAGVNVADAVLAYTAPNSASDQEATAVVRLAEVKAGALGWGTNDGTGVTAGLADLAAKLIIARAD